MKLLLFVIALFPGSTYADDKIYEWILKQYEANNTTIIDNQSVGLINGEEYHIVVARDVNERNGNTSEQEQYLGLFKKSQGKLEPVSLAHLAYVGDQEYPMTEIKNNSIFLTTTNCHHGCYNQRYQFNHIDVQFKLTGFEYLFDTTFAEYSGIDNYLAYCADRTDCGSVATGNSYNFISSTSICWLEVLPEDKAPPKRKNPYQPRGIQHEVTFESAPLQSLDSFDTKKYSTPKSCYFDYKKILHTSN